MRALCTNGDGRCPSCHSAVQDKTCRHSKSCSLLSASQCPSECPHSAPTECGVHAARDQCAAGCSRVWTHGVHLSRVDAATQCSGEGGCVHHCTEHVMQTGMDLCVSNKASRDVVQGNGLPCNTQNNEVAGPTWGDWNDGGTSLPGSSGHSRNVSCSSDSGDSGEACPCRRAQNIALRVTQNYSHHQQRHHRHHCHPPPPQPLHRQQQRQPQPPLPPPPQQQQQQEPEPRPQPAQHVWSDAPEISAHATLVSAPACGRARAPTIPLPSLLPSTSAAGLSMCALPVAPPPASTPSGNHPCSLDVAGPTANLRPPPQPQGPQSDKVANAQCTDEDVARTVAGERAQSPRHTRIRSMGCSTNDECSMPQEPARSLPGAPRPPQPGIRVLQQNATSRPGMDAQLSPSASPGLCGAVVPNLRLGPSFSPPSTNPSGQDQRSVAGQLASVGDQLPSDDRQLPSVGCHLLSDPGQSAFVDHPLPSHQMSIDWFPASPNVKPATSPAWPTQCTDSTAAPSSTLGPGQPPNLSVSDECPALRPGANMNPLPISGPVTDPPSPCPPDLCTHTATDRAPKGPARSLDGGAANDADMGRVPESILRLHLQAAHAGGCSAPDEFFPSGYVQPTAAVSNLLPLVLPFFSESLFLQMDPANPTPNPNELVNVPPDLCFALPDYIYPPPCPLHVQPR